MAILAAKLCNLKEKQIFNILHKIKDVSGRLELVRTFPNNIKVYVDFAHSPDALLKSIKSLKKLSGENISLVFGVWWRSRFYEKTYYGQNSKS